VIDYAAGDVASADEAFEAVWRSLPEMDAIKKMNVWRRALIARSRGDFSDARRWADIAVAQNTGWHLANALGVRAGVALVQGDRQQAEQDVHAALSAAVDTGAHLGVPDLLETVARLSATAEFAARLLGAAEAARQRTGEVRLVVDQADYDVSVATLREAMGEHDFEVVWAEGAGLTTAEAIAYAQRGRGERKRPSSGWQSITPAELDVVRLVCDGLPNKNIAARLFVSPRTVQAHLTHVYAKLDITSRAQLIQLSAKRS
jgi:DNA-binding CsgD family transcriptional regulator